MELPNICRILLDPPKRRDVPVLFTLRQHLEMAIGIRFGLLDEKDLLLKDGPAVCTVLVHSITLKGSHNPSKYEHKKSKQ